MYRFLLVLMLVGTSAFAQDVPVVKFNVIEKLIDDKSSSIQIINFWATWCAPCVKELPFVDAFGASSKAEDVKVTLVNLDFADKLDKVKNFVRLKKVQSPVILLDEIDYNTWIDKVDKDWSGAIPATLIINTKTGKRKFVEKELGNGEIEQLVKELKD